MADRPIHPHHLSIAMRIALLAWSVALVTLLLFVGVTVPQQKKVFMTNLESKANGLAVSLHDVAAGAAINEDYASVVTAAQTLLSGDPDLEFLVVMKNNGFSLVVEQQQWRVEDEAADYWLRRDRVSAGAIQVVPDFERRVFHFAQPFDYSGIEWGWIHVGLSLRSYDKSVSNLYGSTMWLALICLSVSLIFSIFYAQQMVRPILRLRSLVRQVAEGDLSVRADMSRHDELGSLAESVNTMTDALLRRDRILESVRLAAQQFLRTPSWQEIIGEVLGHIGVAAGATRASVLKRNDDVGRCSATRLFEWVPPPGLAHAGEMECRDIDLDRAGLTIWKERLELNRTITLVVSRMTEAEKKFLEPMGVKSLIVIPVFVDNIWWGCLWLEDSVQERDWTDAEEDSLRTAADMLGATIARQQVQEALLDAKRTLEQRVAERTKELRDQIQAKEKALEDLASLQSSLVKASREAGMAEVATGVLHNVGNVLNSVNVSCTILMDQLHDSRVPNVKKLAQLLDEKEDSLDSFLTEDPKGRQVPTYLRSLADVLEREHRTMFKEAEALSSRVEHIKEIVAMQQSYGKVSGITDSISSKQLMEDALKLNFGALLRHNITVMRDYEVDVTVVVDKHKVLQILLNLINNAKHACTESRIDDKLITLKIYRNGPEKIVFEVTDNGTGIAQENLTRIFQHGFTTRRSGHGFGLHSGALAAKELGGRLVARSDGPGLGAAFMLELPVQTGEDR